MTQDYLQNEYRNDCNTYDQFQSINKSQKLLSDAEVKAGVYGIPSKRGRTSSAFVYIMEVE